jgi:hypothetical protein
MDDVIDSAAVIEVSSPEVVVKLPSGVSGLISRMRIHPADERRRLPVTGEVLE